LTIIYIFPAFELSVVADLLKLKNDFKKHEQKKINHGGFYTGDDF